jgi:hypothetical protein
MQAADYQPCLHKVDVSVATGRGSHGIKGGRRRCCVHIRHEDAGALQRQAAAYRQANTVRPAWTTRADGVAQDDMLCMAVMDHMTLQSDAEWCRIIACCFAYGVGGAVVSKYTGRSPCKRLVA